MISIKNKAIAAIKIIPSMIIPFFTIGSDINFTLLFIISNKLYELLYIKILVQNYIIKLDQMMRIEFI